MKIIEGVNATIDKGLKYLESKQRPDGGWTFKVGANVCAGSCANTIGTTALGLLAAYVRSHDPAVLAAATKAGDLLVAIYIASLSISRHQSSLAYSCGAFHQRLCRLLRLPVAAP